MAKQAMDDVFDLKRKARRRLIGAVALTVAIVVVLPMLLDSGPNPVSKDIELRIPDKDKVGEFEPRMSIPPAPAVVSATSAVESVSAPVAASPVPAAPVAAVSGPVVAPQQSKAIAPQAVTEAPKVEATQGAKIQPEPQAGFVVQIGSFIKAESAHELQNKLKKLGFKTYAEKAGDKTRVRAGPFATREAADKVRHKLEAQGLKLKPTVSPAY